MNMTSIIFSREFKSYFTTPVAYVFIIIFLVLAGVFTFYLGHFYEAEEANLRAFFTYLPWLFLFLIPAITMRLWSEERKTGTIELLLTLPISMTQAVLGKFLAAWAFTAITILLTFPLWIIVNILGSPDNGVIICGYFGAILMAGGLLAVGSCISAATKNQVIAFIIALAINFILLLAGFSIVLDAFSGWAPEMLVDAVSSLSFLTHFESMSKGVIDLRDIIYFVSMIIVWLYATAIIIDSKKAS